MYEIDVYNQRWRVSKDLKIQELDLAGISGIEQEFCLTRLREGIDYPTKPEILIDCSDQTMITELKDSEFFLLTEVTLSKSPRAIGFVLFVRGKLDLNGMTIRKKKQSFSDEEISKRRERARKNFGKDKNDR